MTRVLFDLRFTGEDDYPWLCEWWKANRFTPPPIHFLPENGNDGMVISRDGIDICAGFLYSTNSAFSWIEFIVANHEVKDRELRRMAQCHLIDRLSHYAKKLGFQTTFTSCKNPHLKKRFLETGFQIGTDNTTELIKNLHTWE